MFKTALVAAIVAACLLSPAQARHARHLHHRHHASVHRHHHVRMAVRPACDDWLCTFGAAAAATPWHAAPSRPAATSFADAAGRPSRFVAGRLICAINVGAALAERGIRGTGSAAALSYLHWGHSAGGPVPGAVIVSRRRGGGHVAIVSRVERGVVYAWNATGGQRGWREIAYRHPVLDYRVPG